MGTNIKHLTGKQISVPENCQAENQDIAHFHDAFPSEKLRP